MDNKELIFLDALISGDTSGAIERSEKREQNEVVRNQRLPIKSNDHFVPKEFRSLGKEDNMEWEEKFEIERKNNEHWTKEQYKRMGIKVVEKYDDLFLNVILPNSWEIRATDHSMWNEVIDNKGRKRISFFYKGVFYDRDAFSNFEKRYTYSEMSFDEYKTNATYEERQEKEWYRIVYDCEKEIFRTDGIKNKDYFDDSLKKECIKYLDENFSLWQNINSYWD